MQVLMPKFSFIENSFKQIDYFDCYKQSSSEIKDFSLERCVFHFFYDYPIWIKWLFQLRILLSKIPKYRKEKNTVEDFFKPKICLVKGEMISFFTVEELNSNEVLLKAKYTHLDACISFYKHSTEAQCELTISTTVHFNNSFGRVYFFFIKPFHKIIIICLLKNTIKKLSLETSKY